MSVIVDALGYHPVLATASWKLRPRTTAQQLRTSSGAWYCLQMDKSSIRNRWICNLSRETMTLHTFNDFGSGALECDQIRLLMSRYTAPLHLDFVADHRHVIRQSTCSASTRSDLCQESDLLIIRKHDPRSRRHLYSHLGGTISSSELWFLLA